jgi:Crinkler effector protein N-terminal domain
MSENTYRIWCLVEGEDTIFHVIASPTSFISELKEAIKEKWKESVLRGVDAGQLTLWKVRMTMTSDSTTTTNSPAG